MRDKRIERGGLKEGRWNWRELLVGMIREIKKDGMEIARKGGRERKKVVG